MLDREPLSADANGARPTGRVTATIVWTSTVLAGVLTAAALAAGESLPTLLLALPVLMTAAAMGATVSAALLWLISRTSESHQLRWAASGLTVTAFAMWVQLVGFPTISPNGGPLGTSSSGAASLYFFWHLAMPAFAALGVSRWAGSTRLRRVTVTVGVAMTLFLAVGDVSGLVWFDPDLQYLGRTFLMMWAGAVIAVAATVTWVRATGSRPLWTEAAVTATLVLMAWDIAIRPIGVERFTPWWWASLGLRIASTLVPLAFVCIGTVGQHRRLDGYAHAMEVANDAQTLTNLELTALNSELDAYAGVIAHDLRTPLTVAAGAVETVLLHHTIDDATRDLLEMASRRQHDQAEMISDLLRLARARDGAIEPEDLDVTAVVHDIVDTAGLDATVDCGDIPMVHADPSAVRAILQNLLTNAARHGRLNGRASVRVSAATTEGRVEINVDDQGPGVPVAQREEILAPFRRGQTTLVGGAGLGLAIVDRLVARHDGRLRVDDAPGGGARFCFDLAAASSAPTDET